MNIFNYFKNIFKSPFIIGTLFIIIGISILLKKKLPFLRYYVWLDEDEGEDKCEQIKRLIIGISSILLGIFIIVYLGIINS